MDNKGKTVFTKTEVAELKKLIRKRVTTVSKNKQMVLGYKIRKIGFYGSSFGIRDCQMYDFDGLIKKGAITVIDDPEETTPKSYNTYGWLICANFRPLNEVKISSVPTYSAIYCLRMKKGARLPNIYGEVGARKGGIIYIGQTSDMSRRYYEGLEGVKYHTHFFRRLGSILGYLPPKESLSKKYDKTKYLFDISDIEKIREWMLNNLRVNWIPVEKKDLDRIEKELVGKYSPVLNVKYNPYKSEVLEKACAKCMEVANGL